MDAVIYTTNTGSTERYAKLLAQETKLPVYSLAEAAKSVPNGAEILYLGWIAAGSVKGFAMPPSVIISERFALSAWDKPGRRRKACGKRRLFRQAFRCSLCKAISMLKSCRAFIDP